jgi:hypothetical protein
VCLNSLILCTGNTAGIVLILYKIEKSVCVCVSAYSKKSDKSVCPWLDIVMPWNEEDILEEYILWKCVLALSPVDGGLYSSLTKYDGRTAPRPKLFLQWDCRNKGYILPWHVREKQSAFSIRKFRASRRRPTSLTRPKAHPDNAPGCQYMYGAGEGTEGVRYAQANRRRASRRWQLSTYLSEPEPNLSEPEPNLTSPNLNLT